MRDGKGVYTVRDLCYHKQEGEGRRVGGGGGGQMAANTSLVR